MPENAEITKYRTLLLLYKLEKKDCTVTNLAKSLGMEKYTISRVISCLEKEKVVERITPRCIQLTEAGLEKAKKCQERMDVAINHLLYQGVSQEQAWRDALYMSMIVSNETFALIRRMEMSRQMKRKLAEKTHITGKQWVTNMSEGDYDIPFALYRDKGKNGELLSMANEGFVHPCKVHVEAEAGMIHLTRKMITHQSPVTKKKMNGYLSKMKYYDGSCWVQVEQQGDVVKIPMEALQFVNLGGNNDIMFQGCVSVRITSSVGTAHMPESGATLALFF